MAYFLNLKMKYRYNSEVSCNKIGTAVKGSTTVELLTYKLLQFKIFFSRIAEQRKTRWFLEDWNIHWNICLNWYFNLVIDIIDRNNNKPNQFLILLNLIL